MTKVSGSYESVVRGVSEQVPQDRLSGQHTEQVNMVPDPVRGLTRRHGSETQSEVKLPHDFATLLANTTSHRAFPFRADGADFDLLYRSGVRPLEPEIDDTFFCYDREQSAFLPVVLHDTVGTQAIRRAGVSAITSVGRFLVMAGNAYQTTWEADPLWDTAENKARHAVWVRGGAYSRTFKVILTAKLTSEKVEISYTTKASSYPELLDTSDLLTSDPDYQKKVNDRTYAYNSEVTKWIGEAAADIVPANIAQKLLEAYNAAGYPDGEVHGSTLVIEDARWSEVAIDDGGDNSLMEAVGNEIENVDGVGPVHYVGKVVKVRPSKESPDTAFYLRAYAKDDYSTGITEVTWREGCATEYMPNRFLTLGVIYAGVLYISDDLEWLEDKVDPETANDIPTYKGSVVGDDLTNPLPHFLGRTVDYLGMLQDRLVVGSGPVLTLSRTGDYFNFFRSTVLSQPDNDPIELYSLGSEEDVIKYSTMFNRDLILYGQRGQYAISGRQPLTPQTASIVAVSKYEAAIDAQPRAAGNFVFYPTKRGPAGQRRTTLNQIEPAALSENPESRDVSMQLDGYLRGTGAELVTLTSPDTVVLRTTVSRNALYLYNYLDLPGQGRAIDAWHRWVWAEAVGHLMGIVPSNDGDFLAYVLREDHAGDAWLACERFTLHGGLSHRPYMDALRPYSPTDALAEHPAAAVAFGTGDDAYEGEPIDNLGTRDWAGADLGIMYDSYVVPTNPFPKDRQGKPISFGRLTLGPVKVTVDKTGGLTIAAQYQDRDPTTVFDFQGYIVGAPNAALGTQPLYSRSFQAYIGGEVRDCSYVIASKRWLPLTITQIEWAGQIFNTQRRN